MVFIDTDIWQPDESLPFGSEIRELKNYKNTIVKNMRLVENDELAKELSEVEEKLNHLKEQYCQENFNKSSKEYTDEQSRLKFSKVIDEMKRVMGEQD